MKRTLMGVSAMLGSLLRGFAFFAGLMALSMGCVILNARLSPALVWFPLPVLVLVGGATLWAGHRWEIGWQPVRDVSVGHVFALAVAVTVLGVCVIVLQGAWHEMVRATERAPYEVSRAFSFAYAFVMSLVAAVLAEVTFRGIIQTRFQLILGHWPAILIVAALNTAAHRWGPALADQWLGYFVSLAGLGYLRWYSGSLIPPLVVHLVVNLLLAAALWWWGPFDQGQLGATTAGFLAALALIALMVAITLGRKHRLIEP